MVGRALERKLRVADWQVKRNPACPVCELGTCRGFMRVGGRDYWRCPACKATFLDPAQRPDREREEAEYRQHRNAVDDPDYRRFLSRLTEPLLERLPPGSAGLDYGCGPAPALAAMLTAAGQHVEIYDPLFFPDPALLERRYHFITCTEVVEHFHQPAREFARLDRLLDPGGWLAIMTTFQTDDRAFANWHYRRDPTHVVFYRAATFRAVARRYGWACEVPCANVVLLRKR